MGTHQIRLHGILRKIVDYDNWISHTGEPNCFIFHQWSDYLVLRAETITRDEIPIFINYPNLKDVSWIPDPRDITDVHRKFYSDLQKIFVFRELFRVETPGLIMY